MLQVSVVVLYHAVADYHADVVARGLELLIKEDDIDKGPRFVGTGTALVYASVAGGTHSDGVRIVYCFYSFALMPTKGGVVIPGAKRDSAIVVGRRRNNGGELAYVIPTAAKEILDSIQ